MKKLLYRIYKILPVWIRWNISYLYAKKFVVGVSAIVVNNKGKILLLKNSYQYYWSLPGGFLQQGESFRETIEREIKEETGLQTNMKDVIRIRSLPDKPVIDILVLCKVTGGKIIVDSREVTEANFFDVNHLPDEINMPSFQLEYLNIYKQMR